MQTGLDNAEDEQVAINPANAAVPTETADESGLTPAKVMKQYEAVRAMPPADYLAQVPEWLQLAEEALDIFPEPRDTHDQMMTAYRILADEYGSWMTLQGKHSDLMVRLEHIEAARSTGGSVDPADVAWLNQLASEAAPSVPAPVARLLTAARSQPPSPVNAESLSSSNVLSPNDPLSSTDIEIPGLDLADLDRALTEAMGELATPKSKAAPTSVQDTLDRMLADALGASAAASPAELTPPGKPGPVVASPADGLAAPAQSTWWQRWYRIGTTRGPIAQKMQDLRRLQHDLKTAPTGQAGAAPTVADELSVVWHHRVTQAMIAFGYLERLSEQIKALGSRPFNEQHGLAMLRAMCDWCDLLADEVVWLLADLWWETFMEIATRTASGSQGQDSVYTANPQLVESVQAWVRANQKRGEATVSRFMR